MSIFIVRHGESVGNLDIKNYQKQADHSFELTELGVEQSKQAAENIIKASTPGRGEYKWEKPLGHMMWISPFKRARETAAAMKEVFDSKRYKLTSVIESPLLIEKQYGLYNSIAGNGDDGFEEFPKYNQEYIKCDEADGRFFARPPGGESDLDVCIRVEVFWEKLLRKDPKLEYNHTIVCHGTTMRILAMVAMEKEYEWFQRFKLPKNGQIIVPDKGYLEGKKYIPFHV